MKRWMHDSAAKAVILGTVAGTACSVILAIILLGVASESAQIGFIIGLVGVTLSALLSAFVSLAQRLDGIVETVLEGAGLRGLANMPQAKNELVEMTDYLSSISSKREGQEGFFWEASLQTIGEATSSLRAISSGVVNCAAEQEIYFVEKALQSTSTSVCAIAGRGIDWWAQPEADAYWSVYGRAARRLTIRRVFLTESDELSDQMVRVLNRHAELKMETYWAPLSAVPARFRVPIVVFDDKLLHRTTSSTPLGSQHVDFTNSQRSIKEARAQFDSVMGLSGVRRWQLHVKSGSAKKD